MANRFEIIDEDGHNTREAGRLKVDLGARGKDLYGRQS
jgi:hypothetical protein